MTADLIDGIQTGAAAATASPASNSEDAEPTTEPTVDDSSPTSDNYGTDVFDQNVPKYTAVQLDEVRKYAAAYD